MTDPRAAVEFRMPAVDLTQGDLVNTTPGEDDWQQVAGVYLTPEQAKSDELRALLTTLDGRYVVVQLTDLAPVDGGVFFAPDGTAMIYGDDEGSDASVDEVVSHADGLRTYLFTKFELVSVRAS